MKRFVLLVVAVAATAAAAAVQTDRLTLGIRPENFSAGPPITVSIIDTVLLPRS
jgi:hypothetical protein